MTASRFFIVEPAFYERDKNHKFEKFKIIPCLTHNNLFYNEVAFYFAIRDANYA